jgi:chorismate mutase/prephenate dehydratase
MSKTDDINKSLMELISKRAEICIEEIKSPSNDTGRYYPADLIEIDTITSKYNKGPLPDRVIKKIFVEMLMESSMLAKQRSAAFLGPAGSFSNTALSEIFGDSVLSVPCKTITDVFKSVESGDCDLGVVPVENSSEGAVTFTLDELLETELLVSAEHYLKINFSLVSKNSNLQQVKKIYTFSQPLGQCKSWIKSNLPNAEIIITDSTSSAAIAASNDLESAAISSSAAAGIYGLNIIASGIEDSRQNYTRFFVIGRFKNSQSKKDKTSIAFALKDVPGALLEILKPFHKAGINMTKIESRPDKKKIWEYIFFIDISGHSEDPIVKKALNKMKKESVFLKIFGSYPDVNQR